jgi:hypothetical protein
MVYRTRNLLVLAHIDMSSPLALNGLNEILILQIYVLRKFLIVEVNSGELKVSLTKIVYKK